jgi:SAM-dependent methyltransferase
MNYTERIEHNNRYYALFYNNLRNRTDKRNYCELLQLFTSKIKNKEGFILDIGCGLGQHLGYFREKGFNAIGIEPSPVLRELCKENGLNVIDGSFETLANLSLPKISGIWCAASLLHVPLKEVPASANAMAALLQPDDPLFVTYRTGSEGYWDSYDSSTEDVKRFIQLFEPKQLTDMFSENNFDEQYKRLEDSYWGRKATWGSNIFTKRVPA